MHIGYAFIISIPPNTSLSIKPSQTKPVVSNSKKTDPYCESCYAKASFEALFEMDNMIICKKYCNACVKEAIIV